jgi:hypothetical protein
MLNEIIEFQDTLTAAEACIAIRMMADKCGMGEMVTDVYIRGGVLRETNGGKKKRAKVRVKDQIIETEWFQRIGTESMEEEESSDI